MKGRNEIRFCEAAMMEAMQDWCDEHMTDKVTVEAIGVVMEGGSRVFIVGVKDAEDAS